MGIVIKLCVYFLFMFGLFWCFSSYSFAIDLTIIGHIKGSKEIKCPRWFFYFFPNNQLRQDVLNKSTSYIHLTVIVSLLMDSFIFALFIFMDILMLQKNKLSFYFGLIDYNCSFVYFSDD